MAKNGPALLEKPLTEKAISTLHSMTRKGNTLSGKKKKEIRLLCQRIREYTEKRIKAKDNIVYIEISRPDFEAVKKLVSI